MKDDLLDLNNLELPDVNISDEQIKDIKKNLRKTLKRYNESCYTTFSDSLDINDIDIDSLTDPRNKKCYYGVENTIFLKSLALSNIDKITSYEGSLLYKGFASLIYYNRWIQPATFVSGTTFYFYFFITSKEIIIHQLDNYFRLKSTKKYKLSSVVNIQFYEKSNVLKLRFSKDDSIDTFIFCGNNSLIHNDLSKVYKILKALNLKDISKEKTVEKQSDRAIYIFTFSFLGFMFLLFILFDAIPYFIK